MANPTTSKFNFPLLLQSQAQKEVVVSQALTLVDAVIQLSVISRIVATPPASPTNEDAYIIPAGATGAWTGQTDAVAIFVASSGGWVIFPARAGWQAWSQADAGMFVFSSGSWQLQGSAGALTANSITNALLAQAPANTIKGNTTGATANVTDLTALPAGLMPALTGDVTSTTGSVATTIAANAVTNAKAAQMATHTIKGNATASTANAQDLTVLPTSCMPALTGDVTNTAGTLATTIAANAVTSAKFRQSAALSVVGNAGSATANVADIVGAANTLLGVNAAGTAVAFAQATVPQGGTGRGTLGANGILIGEGTAGLNSMGAGTAGQVVKSAGTGVDPGFQDDLATIAFIIGDGVNAVSTGLKGYLEVPFACTILRSTLLADVSGSAVVDVWKTTFAAFDAGSTHPVAADKITASAPPTLSAVTKAQDSTLTGWTTAITSGDILAFNVTSAATVKRLTLSLRVRKG